MSIRDYQPFRYPGGKTKLAKNPAFRALIDSMVQNADTFYEGFLGSAAISLDLALRYPNLKFAACDRDINMSGFWHLVAEGMDEHVEGLIALVAQKPTVELFRQLRARGEAAAAGTESPLTVVERAYHALFFNRTCFSGIAMSQPIGGYNQTSKWTIDCRYNAPALGEKIRNLRKLLGPTVDTIYNGRFTMVHDDCIEWVKRIPNGVPLYLDPPYYVKGDVLYPEKMDAFQHGKLAEALAGRTNWIMSYDICPEVRKLYDWAQLLEIGFRYSINGKKENWKATNEYIITSPELDTHSFEIRG